MPNKGSREERERKYWREVAESTKAPLGSFDWPYVVLRLLDALEEAERGSKAPKPPGG